MSDHQENTEQLAVIEETLPRQKAISDIYREIIAKRKAEREKKKSTRKVVKKKERQS